MTRRDDPALYRAAARVADRLRGYCIDRRDARRLIREAIQRDRDEQATDRLRAYQRIVKRHEAELQRLRGPWLRKEQP